MMMTTKTMKNWTTGKVDDVDIDKLTDDDALMYLPSGDNQLNRTIIQAVYEIYRGNGRTPYEAVVDSLLSILTGKTSDAFNRSDD